MLPAKIRFVSLMAGLLIALLAISAGRSYISSAQVDAQEPVKPDGQPSKLKQLREERLLIARDLLKQVNAKVKNREGAIDELFEPTRLAHEAALDLCESDKERIQVLENFLAAAKDNEKIATGFAKSGQGYQSVALKAKAERLRVEIALEGLKGRKGAPPKGAAIEPARVSVQVGSVQAIDSVRVFGCVPGILKVQNVDIGDRVKRGQVLAVLDVPDLELQVRVDSAVLDQARARVVQAKACVRGAEAELETARLVVKQAEANLKSAAATVRFRTSQLQRMKELYDAKSIEERVLDESKEQHLVAVESESAATTMVAAAKAQGAATTAKIEQVRADLNATEAGLKVAQANLEKSQAQLSLATMVAPFDGVITQRGFSAGEFIRATNNVPLVTVQRTDIVRVVVMVPEREAIFVKVGDATEVELDALPGKKWSAKVSRTAVVLDAKTGTMRVELDLANPTGQIRPGMHAKASILLEK